MSEAQDESKADEGQSRLTVGVERMAITENELAELIRLAGNGKYVGCGFGTQGTDLLPIKDNAWAFKVIAKLRSNV